MFLYLSKLLPLLVYPPGLTIVLLLVAAALRKRLPRSAAALFSFAVFSLYAFSIGSVADALHRPLESTWPAVNVSDLKNADAIVVLGGYLHSPGAHRPAAELNEAGDRLRAAAHLFRAGKAPWILLTGGNQPMLGDTAVPEAQAARGILQEWGVPLEAILVEDRSRNTRENGLFSAPVLQSKGARRLILVTSASHMPRAVAVFRRLGLQVIPFPTDYRSGWEKPNLLKWIPDADALLRSKIALNEWIGMLTYRVRGWA